MSVCGVVIESSVGETMTAVYPLPTALLGLRPVLLLEEGGLPPAIS